MKTSPKWHKKFINDIGNTTLDIVNLRESVFYHVKSFLNEKVNQLNLKKISKDNFLDDKEHNAYMTLNQVVENFYYWFNHINESTYKTEFKHNYETWIDSLLRINRVKAIRDIYQIWGLWFNFLNQKIDESDIDFQQFNVYVYFTRNLIIGDVDGVMNIFGEVFLNYKDQWESFIRELIIA